MGMRDRIKKRRNAQKPREQSYGGSKEKYAQAQKDMRTGINEGNNRIGEGLIGLDDERLAAGGRNSALYDAAGAASADQNARSGVYGAGSDQSMGDYRAGRDATLGGATALDRIGSQMEANANGAAGAYTSAADAAFKASTERNQRAALGIAAGRGNGSIRTALATAGANNAQAAVEQQAIRAQEANQLLGLQQQGLAAAGQAAAGASGIRSGVGGQDQQAAQLLAQRQQASTGAGLAALGQQAQVANNDASLGANAAGARLNAGTSARDAYMGSQNSMEIAQLGGNQAFELQRQEAAKANNPFQKAGSWLGDPMNLRGSKAGNVM